MVDAVLIWICLFIGITGQTLPEGSPDRSTVCQGTDLVGNCLNTDRIAVKSVQYGTKLTTTCSLSNTSAGCCNFDATDCLIDYTGTLQQESCSGKAVCNSVTISAADSTSCGATNYPILNHYLTIEFYCVSGARIGSMCDNFSQTNTGAATYIWNQGYPTKIRSTDTSCDCSVETTTCGEQIKVYFVHFELDDGGGACTDTQKIQIDDDGTEHTFTCSQNTGYIITLKMTSTTNYITVTLDNAAGTNDGYFWLGFEATSSTAPLSINCPATARTKCMDCAGLSNISNGDVSTNGLSTGSTATYSCNGGFTLVGDTTRTCQDNGTWSGSEPICESVECAALEAPMNGSVLPEGVTVGHNASYQCDNGFKLVGDITRTCQNNGTWSGMEPTCTLIECPNLEQPLNGTVTMSGLTVGKTALYECDSSFRLVGDSSRTCQNNSTWSGLAPTCVWLGCLNLDDPLNGNVRIESSNGEYIAHYTCDSGYKLNGDSMRTCLQNGVWSDQMPTCQEINLGDSCPSDTYCLGAIPASTCNNSICTCAAGYIKQNKICVKIGTIENPDEKGMDFGIYIGVIFASMFVFCLLVLGVCYIVRKRSQKPHTTDRHSGENGTTLSEVLQNTVMTEMDMADKWQMYTDMIHLSAQVKLVDLEALQESEASNKTADNEYRSTSNTRKENEENSEKELNQRVIIDNKDAEQQETPLYSSVERMGNITSENLGHEGHDGVVSQIEYATKNNFGQDRRESKLTVDNDVQNIDCIVSHQEPMSESSYIQIRNSKEQAKQNTHSDKRPISSDNKGIADLQEVDNVNTIEHEGTKNKKEHDSVPNRSSDISSDNKDIDDLKEADNNNTSEHEEMKNTKEHDSVPNRRSDTARTTSDKTEESNNGSALTRHSDGSAKPNHIAAVSNVKRDNMLDQSKYIPTKEEPSTSNSTSTNSTDMKDEDALLTAAIAGSLKLNTDLKVERIYDLKQVIEDN